MELFRLKAFNEPEWEMVRPFIEATGCGSTFGSYEGRFHRAIDEQKRMLFEDPAYLLGLLSQPEGTS